MRRTFVLLSAMALLAVAEEPKFERKVLAEIPGDWKQFKPGTWVETKVTVKGMDIKPSTARTTLKEIRDGQAWIKLLRTSDPKDTGYDTTADDSCVLENGLDPDGEEDVKVGDATLHCTVWKAKTTAKDNSHGGKFWICRDSHEIGGVVRMETWDDDGSYSKSTIVKLVETGRVVDVCGRKVRCHVIQSIETRDGEQAIWTLEEIHSPEVPGGMVKRTNVRKEKRVDGTKAKPVEETVEVMSVEEVTAVHLEGEDWAPAGKDEKK